ncbi:hypothetical protein F4778DRAFT_725691 [Xylariomycetidae sp. FL2044]|nr:hypothetical protein F4778DRAFT_725691 [Xylariomycetidae sp. FL2044]
MCQYGYRAYNGCPHPLSPEDPPKPVGSCNRIEPHHVTYPPTHDANRPKTDCEKCKILDAQLRKGFPSDDFLTRLGLPAPFPDVPELKAATEAMDKLLQDDYFHHGPFGNKSDEHDRLYIISCTNVRTLRAFVENVLLPRVENYYYDIAILRELFITLVPKMIHRIPNGTEPYEPPHPIMTRMYLERAFGIMHFDVLRLDTESQRKQGSTALWELHAFAKNRKRELNEEDDDYIKAVQRRPEDLRSRGFTVPDFGHDPAYTDFLDWVKQARSAG